MVIFTCGECGMHFQVAEEWMLKKNTQRCPNCNAAFPSGSIESVKVLIQCNMQNSLSQVFLVEDKDIKGVINGTVSL